MTCASCTALKLLENHRTGEMEHYCLTWLRFQDPDADACRNCQPDHGEQVITQEMALAMVVGA